MEKFIGLIFTFLKNPRENIVVMPIICETHAREKDRCAPQFTKNWKQDNQVYKFQTQGFERLHSQIIWTRIIEIISSRFYMR